MLWMRIKFRMLHRSYQPLQHDVSPRQCRRQAIWHSWEAWHLECKPRRESMGSYQCVLPLMQGVRIPACSQDCYGVARLGGVKAVEQAPAVQSVAMLIWLDGAAG